MKFIKEIGIKKRVLVIHGPNVNITADRDLREYTKETFETLNEQLLQYAAAAGLECRIWQSNIEGRIVTQIQKAKDSFDGIILNAGSYSQYSLAIRDAVSAVKLPTVEVHTHNIEHRREGDRASVIAPVCVGEIIGFGKKSYILALEGLRHLM